MAYIIQEAEVEESLGGDSHRLCAHQLRSLLFPQLRSYKLDNSGNSANASLSVKIDEFQLWNLW